MSTPTDYFQGREAIRNASPLNILAFTRDNVEALHGSHTRGSQHHRFVLVYAASGSGHILINDRSVGMEPGRLYLIFPYELHLYREVSTEGLLWYFITFESDDLIEISSNLNQRFWNSTPTIEQLLQNFTDSWLKQKEGLVHHLSLILIELKNAASTPDNTHHARPKENIFLRVNSALRGAPNYQWSIDEIAKAVGVSTRHLCRLFRAETSLSIGSYIRRYRVMRAAQLIQTTTSRMGEIADQCGFDSPYAFSRTFKKEMGVSPLDYRKRK